MMNLRNVAQRTPFETESAGLPVNPTPFNPLPTRMPHNES
jgi:hypothetical protein